MAWDTFGTSEQQEKTVSILSALVAADTSNPPGNEEPLAEAIMELLRENGAGEELFSLMRHTPGRASLVVSLPGKNSGVVAFAGHLDVVPAGRPEAWTHPPFVPYVENGVLHGRGAADMKGGLTSMLLVCLHYLRQGPPPVTLRFFFTADEESGGAGISALRGAGWFEDVSFLFICEPTACRAGLCEKGLMWLKCTATGRTSHAAMAAEGVNAAELGFAFLMEAKPRMEALFGTHAYLGQNSFSVTMMEAGVKLNVVPDAADFSVDVRTIPAAGFCNERLLEEARALAAAFAARCPGLSLDIEVLNTREALESDAAHPATAEALALCDEVANAGPPRGLSFFTDGALVLIHYPRLPFLILGPGEPALCHAPNEAVPLREVGLCAEMYRAFVERAAEKGLL